MNKMYTPQDKFEHLKNLLRHPDFRQNRILGNETSFYIAPYEPHEYEEMKKSIQLLQKQLQQNAVRIKTIDVYETVLEILRESEDLAYYLENEKLFPKEKLLEDLTGILKSKVIVDSIGKQIIQTYDVLFITGVGALFPYVRVHNIIEGLQSNFPGQIIVMFFPGEYVQNLEGGSQLNLFGLLSDSHYRAKNIFEVTTEILS